MSDANTKIEWVESIPYFTKHGIVHHKSIPVDWRGIQVRTQSEADERIPLLLQTPAVVRFLSCEPLLSDLNLRGYLGLEPWQLNGEVQMCQPGMLRWVIIGGESGNARPCNLAWIRSIVEQCKTAEVPVFVKQLGSNIRVPYYHDGNLLRDWALDHAKKVRWPDGDEHDEGFQPPPGSYIEVRLKDKKGGNPAEWPDDLRVREYPR